MRSRLIEALRAPQLTGPVAIVRPDATSTTDPAHWHPQYEEPIYRELYAERREQLLVSLRTGMLDEAVSPC